MVVQAIASSKYTLKLLANCIVVDDSFVELAPGYDGTGNSEQQRYMEAARKLVRNKMSGRTKTSTHWVAVDPFDVDHSVPTNSKIALTVKQLKSGKVLLYGSEMWTSLSAMTTMLTHFHHQTARHLANTSIQQLASGKWEIPLAATAFTTWQMYSIPHYLQVRSTYLHRFIDAHWTTKQGTATPCAPTQQQKSIYGTASTTRKLTTNNTQHNKQAHQPRHSHSTPTICKIHVGIS